MIQTIILILLSIYNIIENTCVCLSQELLFFLNSDFLLFLNHIRITESKDHCDAHGLIFKTASHDGSTGSNPVAGALS